MGWKEKIYFKLPQRFPSDSFKHFGTFSFNFYCRWSTCNSHILPPSCLYRMIFVSNDELRIYFCLKLEFLYLWYFIEKCAFRVVRNRVCLSANLKSLQMSNQNLDFRQLYVSSLGSNVILFDTSSSLTYEAKPRTLNERVSKRHFWGEWWMILFVIMKVILR